MIAPMPETSAPDLFHALGHDVADKRIAILRGIGAGGSISQAARDAGVSYKAAWQAVDTLTNLAGVALVERAVGGAGGGGALLTEAGWALLRAADAMAQARALVWGRLQAPAGLEQALARLSVQTSMRNQWPCRITALEDLGPLVRVHLQADAGEGATASLQVVARITRESAELLALAPGSAVLALCKATTVDVAPAEAADSGAATAAGTNVWWGEAEQVSPGSGGAEVAARLEAGVRLVGFAAPGVAVQAGQRVGLRVSENAVVLARVQAV